MMNKAKIDNALRAKKTFAAAERDYTPSQARAVCERFAQRSRELNVELCFLLEYIPSDALAGLEMSSFRRVAQFEKYLGAQSVLLLTTNYQSRGAENALRQIELGRFQSARVLNLYDYLQGITRAPGEGPLTREPEFAPSPAWCSKSANKGIDTVTEDREGHCTMYIRRYPSGEGVDYVNFLANGKIYRRDTYDIQGFLSRTEFIDPADGFTLSSLYFRPDHSLALSITFKRTGKDGKRSEVSSVQLINSQGQCFRCFKSMRDLVGWWLPRVLTEQSKFYLVIADHCDVYREGLKALNKLSKEQPEIRVAAVVHNAHMMDPLDPNSPLGGNYEYLINQELRIDVLVMLTDWQRRDVQERYPDKAHPATVIPHALKEEIETKEVPAAPTLPPHSMTLVARLFESKGQEKAMEVLQLVLKEVPDATLHLCGEGPDEKQFKACAEKLGLKDKVIFHGFVDDMESIYAQSALTLSCSRFEGFSLVVQESLRYGCPAVVFDCRYGPGSMVKDGVNGYSIEPGDIKTMAERCIAILKDESLRQKLSEGAVSSMRNYAPQAIAARWAALFLALLPRRIRNAAVKGEE